MDTSGSYSFYKGAWQIKHGNKGNPESPIHFKLTAGVYNTTPFFLNSLTAFWPPSRSTNHFINFPAISLDRFFSGWPRSALQGLSRLDPSSLLESPDLELLGSVPSLKISKLSVTLLGDDNHVPLSVNVYSERKDAAWSAWRGKRGYWWYHEEYAKAHGTCKFVGRNWIWRVED